MENFYRLRKVFACLLFIVALAWVLSARAEYVDLSGGDVLAEPVACLHNGKRYACIPVGKDGKVYMILVDKKGECLIYQLINNEAVLLWARDAV